MRRQHLTSWVFVGALFAICAVLGFLQYRWIGEVSIAARDRLRASLQANLNQLSLDLNSEISTPCRALLPNGAPDLESAEREIERRYELWKTRPQARQIVNRMAIAFPQGETPGLRVLNWETGRFEDASWPPDWQLTRERLASRMAAEHAPGEREFGRGQGLQRRDGEPDLLVESPLFQGPGGFPFGRRELAWVLFDLNLPQIRNVLLPEAVERHLGTGGTLEYAVQVVTRTQPSSVVYASDPDATTAWARADAAVGLLDIRFIEGGGRGGRGGRGRMGMAISGSPFDSGRWQLLVRHRAGSLDAAVARARWRNLAVTGGVLLLLVITLGALLRFTRNAQQLAQLQMDFVAGVSHELRTPLTALYTAGHNLRGRVAQQPAQVERYGEMIQLEAGRLKDLVEQVLRFAGANAGRVIQEPAPASVAKIVEEAVEAGRPLLHSARCAIETEIAPDLPPILADSFALKQAVQNLLTNAVKYGARENGWVRISAARSSDGGSGVEIRVADRGPGIPEDERAHIFDAFYRGRRAIQEQIHGAGLGLNLVKRIVEAHGGSIEVESEAGKGAEFIVRLPAAPAGAQS